MSCSDLHADGLTAAEQVLDAEISHLLVLKQLRLLLRTQQQLRQVALGSNASTTAGPATGMVPAGCTGLAQAMPALQTQDLMAELTATLPSKLHNGSNMATTPEAPWPAAIVSNGHATMDMGYLQHIPCADSTAVMAESSFLSGAPFGSVAMQQRLSFSTVDAGPFSNPIQHQQTILTAGLTVDAGMPAAYSGLSTQDSSPTMLLSPQTVCMSAVPSPAMSRIGSAGVLNPMQSLQDHGVQQCIVSSASGGLMVPACATYMLVPAQAQYCGSTVLAGQAMVPGMAGAAAAQAKVCTRSFHLHPSTPGGGYAVTAASAGQFGAATTAQFNGAHAGYVTPVLNGPEMPMCTPAVPHNLRTGGPRMRRFSAEVQSAGTAYAPCMQTMHMQAAPGPMTYAPSQLYGSSVAHTGPPSRAASFGGLQDASASRHSFDVRQITSVAGVGARQSLDVSCSSAAPNRARPSWPKAENEGSVSPAKKGTGVFMPRHAA